MRVNGPVTRIQQHGTHKNWSKPQGMVLTCLPAFAVNRNTYFFPLRVK